MADYDIGAAFGEIEDELISSMIRNLKRHQVEEIAEGMEWSQWQALQLQALEDYKRKAAQKYGSKFSTINDKVDKMLTDTYNTAETSQEQKILKAIQKGIPETVTPLTGSGEIQGEFFKTNDRKLDALIKATTSDMEKAEHAVLRMTDDKYRKIIFNAQVYANTGAGTYQKAVDMATKDFLSAGINCIEYKNGRRVPIDVYAEMALRTANKRAYLQGEGEMRKKWGIHTVIMNKRTNPCPKCAPFVGKVIVDDVWSGGTAEEAEEKGYLLMSDCIKRGLYHPNCQDSHTTYFGDILDEEDEENTEEQEQTEGEPETNDKGVSETDTSKNAESSTEDGVRQMPLTEESEYFARENGYDSTVPTSENQITPREQRINEQLYDAEQRQNHCERQVQRFERMGKYSLDKDNQRIYKARKSEWKEKKKEVDLQINEIKREINKAQKKVKRTHINLLELDLLTTDRVTNFSLNISSDDSDNEEKNVKYSPRDIANSRKSDIMISELTEDEKAAINAYISSESYKINEKLRSGMPLTKEEKWLVDNLDSALEKLPKYKGTVYRSLDSSMIDNPAEFWRLHQPGNVVQYSAFTSTSLNVYDGNMDIQCVIKSNKGRDITAFNPNEQEVLFGRDSNFIITEVKGNTIFMEEV